MRILGFSEKLEKLNKKEFTSFRPRRKDRDWGVCEDVQVVYKPRSKNREVLGVAKIIEREPRFMASYMLGGQFAFNVSHLEAVEDGFENIVEMMKWFKKTYGEDCLTQKVMNKLTLRWVGRE